ncbi:hypothetical protein CPB84DRAFT_1852440 [Gymnopilus junonius]|uniref:Uncharacterized protein n=1 Tax=Gymnopilus junonius TaxID=109634 RepID=A0A9P5NAD6_GYMJU|nr:hypothetical protein CPB84DRAFT_1852440 [Gymnopilus junonius]
MLEEELYEYFTHEYHQYGGIKKCKPLPGEEVFYVPITQDFAIRLFDGGLQHICYFCFDFINKAKKPIQKPKDVHIFAESIGFMPEAEIFSIEENIEQSLGDMTWFQRTILETNPNCDLQTYLIPEGTVLQIERPGVLAVRHMVPSRQGPASFQPNWD